MLGDIQVKTEQDQLKKQADCLSFMRHGLAVIHDRVLLMELEIAAGLSPKIDVKHYQDALKAAFLERVRMLYDVETISPVFTQAKVNLTEYGLE